MIAFLRGKIAGVNPDHVVMDVQGVGYKVYVAPSLAATFRLGQEALLHTQLVWREDGPTLYGFADPRERDFFVLVQTVPGIGPKVALGVVAAGIDRVSRAVVEEDVAFLRGLSGVGRKTADRLVVDLRDRLSGLVPDAAGPEREGSGVRPMEDVVAALSALGYNEREIQSIMPVLRREWKEGREPEEMIRLALSQLAHR
ncbi:Holliday junction branch migration protein RuvA [Kyrpidia spormannii]|nr:Holliday junction branch migration protein RuvA [Kyrpidia spormannii]